MPTPTSFTENGTIQHENYLDRWYKDYLRDILENGKESSDRTGTGTTKVFGQHARFDLQKGFPLLTTKAVWFKGIARELMWFLRGRTNIWHLVQDDVSIWTGNAYADYKDSSSFDGITQEQFEDRIRECDNPDKLPDGRSSFAKKWGDIGPVYGKQWRDYEGIAERHDEVSKALADVRGGYPESKRANVDQIERLIEGLRENPMSRRHVVSAWNPTQTENMAIPPCHYSFQCYVEDMTVQERQRWAQSQDMNVRSVRVPKTTSDDKNEWHWRFDELGIPRRSLSLMWNQRSVDSFLGLPFNIASYAILTHLLGRHAGLAPKEIIFSGGDCHIYNNHREQVREQLSRIGSSYLPRLSLPDGLANDLGNYSAKEFGIEQYAPADPIEAEMCA